MAFETGVVALSAAIERMQDRGDLSGEDLATLVAALHENVGPDATFVAQPLVELTAKLADRI